MESETEKKLSILEEKVNGLERQLQGLKKAILDCAKITDVIEKAVKSLVTEQKLIIPTVAEKKAESEKAPIPVEIVDKTTGISESLLKLLNSPEWPQAVNPDLIVNEDSEEDKETRAEAIFEIIIDVHLENLSFLDFGCGEGHVANRAITQKPKISVGYDITKQEKWDKWQKVPNLVFTDGWEEVKQLGPYNVVLMYDVIDHMTLNNTEIIAKLKEVKSLLAPNGKVYVRCHPWCSRHGTHMYRSLNKAYAHVVFSEEELEKLGYKQEKVRKIKHPVHEYKKLFSEAGFKIKQGPREEKEPIESFFIKNQEIRSRIQGQYKDSIWENIRKGDFPSGPLDIQFIDYILI